MAGKREESWAKARQTIVTLCLKEFRLEIGRQRILSERIDKLDGDIIKFLRICDVIDPKATQVISNPKGDAAMAASLLEDFLEAAVEFRKFSTELTSKIQSKIDGIKEEANNRKPESQRKHNPRVEGVQDRARFTRQVQRIMAGHQANGT